MNRWTREQEIVVFNLYCKIPFQRSSKNHPDVIEIAKLIGRTPSAVNMKIGNFGSFDEALKKQGIRGLQNASKLDEEIFNEFNGNWDELAFESEKLIAQFKNINIKYQIDENIIIPLGKERSSITKQRVNQTFFRNAVLASYSDACCITGISNKELLIASHIKPYSKSSPDEKTNPCNGLCLNALHDKAFDRGFITVKKDYTVIVSSKLEDVCSGEAIKRYFSCIDKTKIRLPDKFLPSKEFLEYHNDCVYLG